VPKIADTEHESRLHSEQTAEKKIKADAAGEKLHFTKILISEHEKKLERDAHLLHAILRRRDMTHEKLLLALLEWKYT
jgi:hypothetical protein